MITEGLPIKCLEAVVLLIHLTNSIDDIDRFVLSFKSTVDDNIYRHVVLVIYHNKKYGALGLSRRRDLMDKPVEFDSLSNLILNYKKSYEDNFHKLIKVKVGLPIPFDLSSNEKLIWNAKSFNISDDDTLQSTCNYINNFARGIRK
ncbi:Tubulinyl-Tyr carboxypeptidase 2 [Lobulomyces angularis]|nr:Tubulinyl-Tyr carboxypeptidase 2 [Lobulomyces angularis]